MLDLQEAAPSGFGSGDQVLAVAASRKTHLVRPIPASSSTPRLAPEKNATKATPSLLAPQQDVNARKRCKRND